MKPSRTRKQQGVRLSDHHKTGDGKDPSDKIKFGTDGWRGVIAEDFTDDNLRIVVHAIARYVARAEKPGSGILVGFDTRFGSERFARVAAETVAAAGSPGVAFARCVSHAGDFSAGEVARGGGRDSDYGEPQSLPMERRETKGELRKFRFGGDRIASGEGTRKSSARWSAAIAAAKGFDSFARCASALPRGARSFSGLGAATLFEVSLSD